MVLFLLIKVREPGLFNINAFKGDFPISEFQNRRMDSKETELDGPTIIISE